MIYIGIDPDAVNSGVAIWDSATKKLVEYKLMDFWSIYSFLSQGKAEKVIIEAGWLNKKSNWHNERAGIRVASRIGAKVGANHQTGKLLAEACEHLEIPYELVRPQGKMNAKNFERITGIKRSNQDVRDAILLVWNK